MAAGLSPGRLLEARDAGSGLHPLDRALAVLRLAAEPGGADPAEWPIALRDRRLVAIHRQTFGDYLACLVDCPDCGERQEFDLSAGALGEAIGDSPEPETFAGEGWQVSLRPLDSRDLAAAARAGSLDRAVEALAERAVAAILAPGGTAGLAELPAAAREAVVARIGERESAADLAIELRCPDCGHVWTTGLDIGEHLWAQIDRHSDRLLGEVAALAERFGWSEAEILALPASRRRFYLAVEAVR
ncbi:MAG TPA: hypothetical protein VEW26_07945 [Allosphingosinicella sp.]|nr:hypothetical protein [Allosphingosinicella sp.]